MEIPLDSLDFEGTYLCSCTHPSVDDHTDLLEVVVHFLTLGDDLVPEDEVEHRASNDLDRLVPVDAW